MRNIETISSSILLVEELKNQNRLFNLHDFYNQKDETRIRGAVQVIMPQHSLAFYANQSHSGAVKRVFNILYDDFHGFNTQVWQNECCERGNVIFEFCSNGFSLAWFPTKITSFQLKKVTVNRILIDEINKELSDNPIIVETNLLDDNGGMLSLEDAAEKIKKMTY